ncbi:hypothetical protein ABIA65_002747 [Mycolicibacterium sp. 624]
MRSDPLVQAAHSDPLAVAAGRLDPQAARVLPVPVPQARAQPGLVPQARVPPGRAQALPARAGVAEPGVPVLPRQRPALRGSLRSCS